MSSETSVGARRTGVGGTASPPASGKDARAAGPKTPAPSKPTRGRRRPAVIALGIALVALGILASVYLTTTLGQTHKVLAVTADVPRGQEIAAGDLTSVDLPTGPTLLDPVDATALDDVVGQRATADLLAGSLLTATSYEATLRPDAGHSIVGVALTPNQMPAGTPLRSGDPVRVIETPVNGGDAPVEEPFAIPAVVVTSHAAAIGDQTVVDVEVAHNQAAALAARAATGRVALVLDTSQAAGDAPAGGEDAPAGGGGQGSGANGEGGVGDSAAGDSATNGDG
ncbi:SAF domain-containing protein [Myceligenerans cantabricum]